MDRRADAAAHTIDQGRAVARVLRRHGLAVSVVAQDLPFVRRSMARALTNLAGIGALHFADSDPRRLADVAIAAVERTATGLIMVYLQHCDRAGHEHGCPVVIRRPVSLLDVPVTIAQALGVPVPPSYQGRSLMDPLTAREAVPA